MRERASCHDRALPARVFSRSLPHPLRTVRTPLSETHFAAPGSLPSASNRNVKDRPSTDIPAGVHSHEPEGSLRPDAAKRPTCSVFAVPPRPDGFLLQRLRGLVASHCRSWGSPGFRPQGRACLHDHPRRPRRCHTLQSSPLTRPRCHPSPGALPPRRSPHPSRDGGSTSRPCSYGESVAPAHRCRCGTPVALLGFSSPELRAPLVLGADPEGTDLTNPHPHGRCELLANEGSCRADAPARVRFLPAPSPPSTSSSAAMSRGLPAPLRQARRPSVWVRTSHADVAAHPRTRRSRGNARRGPCAP